jgi:hypothetical protein
MKELIRFRQFLNENLDEISLRGLMGRDMTGAEIAADPKKFEALLGKIMSHIGDPSLEDRVRAWLKVELEEFADTDFSDPEEVKMTAKSAAYAMGLDDDDDLPDMPPLEEEQLDENKKDTLRSLIQDLTSVEYETFADDVGVDPEDGAEMEEFIASISDQQADKYISMLKEVNEDKNEE